MSDKLQLQADRAYLVRTLDETRRQRDEAERRMHNAVRFYGELAASIVRVRRAVSAHLCAPCEAAVLDALDAEPFEVDLTPDRPDHEHDQADG